MKQVFALLVYPKRQVLVRQGISIALIYLFLLPYQMHYLQTWGEMTASREIFKTDQMFLPLLLLWSLFQFFLPVYQSGTKEVLQSLRHPVTSAALMLMLLQQVNLPLYLWTYVSLPLRFRPNRMLDGFTLDYWVIYGGILCLLVAFLAVKYQLGKPKQAI